jgi:hypothetical protein
VSGGRGGGRLKVRDDDGRGGARRNAGPPKTRWKAVFHDDVRVALAVMGMVDAVKAGTRQDEAEIGLVERLIRDERARRLAGD